MKQDLIKKWYNPELTDEQNVSLLKEHGISISKRTLITWRKNQGIAKQRGGDRKSIDFKNQSAISKVQNITDKSKCNFQSANSSENQSEKIKVQNSLNQSAKVTKSKCKNQDAILENQSAISDQSEKSKVQKQSAKFTKAKCNFRPK